MTRTQERAVQAVVALAVVALLATAAVAPAAAAAPPDNESNGTTTAPPTTTQPDDDSETDGSSTAPNASTVVRITPVQTDEAYKSVSVLKKDSAFNTTGPEVLFELSQPVESARITQQQADVTVLGGGQTLLVEYGSNASVGSQASLYTLELFFADGSSKSIDLYARKTSVDVASTKYRKFAPFIKKAQELAKEDGYDAQDPEAMQEYVETTDEQAQLVDGFLVKEAQDFLAWLLIGAMNWITWLVLIGILTLIGYWARGKFGQFVDVLENDPGRARRNRREFIQRLREERQTAAEEPLSEIDAIGAEATIWEDALGIRSPAQLANAAKRGLPVRNAQGEVEFVGAGVDGIDPEKPRESWLEPVLREGRIETPEQALGQLKAACEYMETRYSEGYRYRETRDKIMGLIEQMQDTSPVKATTGSTLRSAVGGDD